jgi:hypothetical protein
MVPLEGESLNPEGYRELLCNPQSLREISGGAGGGT